MTKHSAPLKLPRRFIPFFQLFFCLFFYELTEILMYRTHVLCATNGKWSVGKSAICGSCAGRQTPSPHQLFVYDILLCGQMFIQTKRQIGDLCVVCFPFASFVVVVVVVLVFIKHFVGGRCATSIHATPHHRPNPIVPKAAHGKTNRPKPYTQHTNTGPKLVSPIIYYSRSVLE